MAFGGGVKTPGSCDAAGAGGAVAGGSFCSGRSAPSMALVGGSGGAAAIASDLGGGRTGAVGGTTAGAIARGAIARGTAGETDAKEGAELTGADGSAFACRASFPRALAMACR